MKAPIAAWSSLQFHRDTSRNSIKSLIITPCKPPFTLLCIKFALGVCYSPMDQSSSHHGLPEQQSKKDDTRKLATIGECGRTGSPDKHNCTIDYAIKIERKNTMTQTSGRRGGYLPCTARWGRTCQLPMRSLGRPCYNDQSIR